MTVTRHIDLVAGGPSWTPDSGAPSGTPGETPLGIYLGPRPRPRRPGATPRGPPERNPWQETDSSLALVPRAGGETRGSRGKGGAQRLHVLKSDVDSIIQSMYSIPQSKHSITPWIY